MEKLHEHKTAPKRRARRDKYFHLRQPKVLRSYGFHNRGELFGGRMSTLRLFKEVNFKNENCDKKQSKRTSCNLGRPIEI